MSTTLFGRSALLFGCAVGALAAAGSAAAQTAPADPAQLDEIVVTAERRSENLQDVPVSVGVVPGDQLRAIQAGGGDILELAARCLLYTSPSPRDKRQSRMPSSA